MIKQEETECRDCPYINEEFNRKTKGKTEEYDLYEFERSCWCEKIGGKIWLYGKCCDFVNKNIPDIKQCSKHMKRSKRERYLKYKQHLKFLTEKANSYPSSVMYIDKIYIKGYGWIENTKPHYKRLYRDNHKNGRYKWYKKYANRQVRRYKGELHNKGNQYRKIFDYWWTVD